MRIGQTLSRKVDAAASQPAITASSQLTSHTSTTATSSPTHVTTTARRMEEACQPIHRWYSVAGGREVIVGVSPSPSSSAPVRRLSLARPG
jgi:hypothetical protein